MELPGPEAYKTYAMLAPPQSHFRRASCEEVDCPRFLRGWRVVLAASQTDHLESARRSGRKYTEEFDGSTYTLTFEPGQPCFQVDLHRLRLERDFVYVVRDGDARGNPFGTKPVVHKRPELWIEDFSEHTDALARARGER